MMNQKQKILLSIIVPIIIFLTTLTFMFQGNRNYLFWNKIIISLIAAFILIGVLEWFLFGISEEYYFKKAVKHLNEGSYSKAILAYNMAIKGNSGNILARINRGIAYYYDYQFERAFSDLDEAINVINPYLNYAKAYHFRGQIYAKQGNLNQAVSDYNKAIDINPDDPIQYFNRGQAYKWKHQLELALSDYSKAIELYPTYVSAYIYRAFIYDTKNEFDLAVADLEKAIEISPETASIHASLAIIYYKMGEYEQAMPHIDKAISLNPDNGSLYSTRASIYLKLNRDDEAWDDLHKAKSLWGQNSSSSGLMTGLAGACHQALRAITMQS